MMQDIEQKQDFFAAIDLGSNSFHMVVARLINERLEIVDRLREMVRLADGLDKGNCIQPHTQQRAQECLKRFSQRLIDIPRENIRAVGTNAFRKADNALEFQTCAEQSLGLPIEIVSGIEEARLIYLGVSQTVESDNNRMLVIDIGGGSTELIIGEQTSPCIMESLEMGCVSVTQQFFKNGKISTKKIDNARIFAEIELEPHIRRFRKTGWKKAIGTSGTIRAIERVVKRKGWCDAGVSLAALEQLLEEMCTLEHVDAVAFDGLGDQRQPVFIGGIIILTTIFNKLKIDHIQISDGALREGILYDLIGRYQNQDIRSHSVDQMALRYQTDRAHAALVEKSALACLVFVQDDWGLDNPIYAQWLRWGARLHETGLAIAHSRHHHHAAYIIANSDLAGFSQQEQQMLALLVRSQRRKFPIKRYETLSKQWKKSAIKLAILLRLGVVLQRNRKEDMPPLSGVKIKDKQLTLMLPQQWLMEHPLTQADLIQENQHLRETGYSIATQAVA